MTATGGDRVLFLHPSVPVLSRRDGSVQLGLDPERAVMVEPRPGLDGTAVVALLRRLTEGLARADAVRAARSLGIEQVDADEILTALDSAGLLERPTHDGHRAAIHVHGRGPLADALWTGLRRQGLTLRRSRSCAPSPDIAGWRADVVVLADNLVADPHLVEQLLAAGLPHLQVRVRDGLGIVGPLVVPGDTSCLRCADLTRRELDPEWPYLAAQLIGRTGYARPAAIAATAALALDQLDALCSGSARRRAAVRDTTLELDLASLRIATRRWPRHHACDCSAVTCR